MTASKRVEAKECVTTTEIPPAAALMCQTQTSKGWQIQFNSCFNGCILYLHPRPFDSFIHRLLISAISACQYPPPPVSMNINTCLIRKGPLPRTYQQPRGPKQERPDLGHSYGRPWTGLRRTWRRCCWQAGSKPQLWLTRRLGGGGS